MANWRRFLDVATTIVLAVMAIVVIWNNLSSRANRQPDRDADLKKLVGKTIEFGSEVKGSSTAPVALIEFSDFECSFCGAFARTTMPALVRQYVDSGRLAIAFRHFPNESIHKNALYAAEAATCAGQQGKFWPIHDLFFSEGAHLDPASVRALASELRIDAGAFDRCVDGVAPSIVDADLRTAVGLRFAGTPAFVIGRRTDQRRLVATQFITGNRPLKSFEDAIESALRKNAGT